MHFGCSYYLIGIFLILWWIGPCNFSTLMGFLSASALGKVMGQAAGYWSTNFELGSFRQPSDSQISRAKHTEKLEGPIVMITAVRPRYCSWHHKTSRMAIEGATSRRNEVVTCHRHTPKEKKKDKKKPTSFILSSAINHSISFCALFTHSFIFDMRVMSTQWNPVHLQCRFCGVRNITWFSILVDHWCLYGTITIIFDVPYSYGAYSQDICMPCIPGNSLGNEILSIVLLLR